MLIFTIENFISFGVPDLERMFVDTIADIGFAIGAIIDLANHVRDSQFLSNATYQLAEACYACGIPDIKGTLSIHDLGLWREIAKTNLENIARVLVEAFS